MYNHSHEMVYLALFGYNSSLFEDQAAPVRDEIHL